MYSLGVFRSPRPTRAENTSSSLDVTSHVPYCDSLGRFRPRTPDCTSGTSSTAMCYDSLGRIRPRTSFTVKSLLSDMYLLRFPRACSTANTSEPACRERAVSIFDPLGSKEPRTRPRKEWTASPSLRSPRLEGAENTRARTRCRRRASSSFDPLVRFRTRTIVPEQASGTPSGIEIPSAPESREHARLPRAFRA